MSENNSNYKEILEEIMNAFRNKYPQGKTAVEISPQSSNCLLVRARVYSDFNCEDKNYLAEFTTARTLQENESIEDSFEIVQVQALKAVFTCAGVYMENKAPAKKEGESKGDDYEVEENKEPEKSIEERVKEAMQLPCPISKYKGMTLGEVLRMDENALKWICEKYKNDETISNGARLICEYAAQQASA